MLTGDLTLYIVEKDEKGSEGFYRRRGIHLEIQTVFSQPDAGT